MLADALEPLIRGSVSRPDDVGKVIGRSGRTATALRTVIGALAGAQDVRIDFVDVDKLARRGGGGRRR
jgi:predicted RNA-binding protein YlqC (UPF0109 family)